MMIVVSMNNMTGEVPGSTATPRNRQEKYRENEFQEPWKEPRPGFFT